MSKEIKIEWADSTVNFWSGCTKVSAGCANCYAEALSHRKLGNIGEWGKGAPRKRHQSAFNLALRLNKKPWICDGCGHEHQAEVAKDASEIIECRGCLVPVSIHRRRVFSLSLGDWLDPEVPIEWLAEMLDTIRKCDELKWLLVTKRPELWHGRMEQVRSWCIKDAGESWLDLHLFVHNWFARCDVAPPSNIMVLTSVEDQKAADERIPKLLEIPGRHGLSCEPLLGPVNIPKVLKQAIGYNPDGSKRCKIATPNGVPMIDWVIVGGESGPGARACNVEWIRSIKDQCRVAGVPVFVKQFGANVIHTGADPRMLWPVGKWNHEEPHDVSLTHKKGGDITEWPADLRVRQFPV